MKHKIVYQTASILLAVFVALSFVGADFSAAYAEDGEWELGLPDVMWAGQTWALDNLYNSDDETATVDSATSDNENVLIIKNVTWTDENGIEYSGFDVVPKGAGTANITVNYTDPNGITGTVTKKQKVKKYPNEIKSLKVNGKKININKNKFGYYKSGTKKTSVTVKMALKKGWKIDYVSATAGKYNSEKYKSIKVTKKTLLKGKKISFSKKYEYLNIWVNLKKGNDTISYSIDFSR